MYARPVLYSSMSLNVAFKLEESTIYAEVKVQLWRFVCVMYVSVCVCACVCVMCVTMPIGCNNLFLG